MYIFPVKIQTNNYVQQSRTNFCGGLKKDIVPISQKEFLKLPPKEIWARIQDSVLNAKNYLGYGGFAEVWKIEGTDYCIKLPYKSSLGHSAKPRFNLTMQDKVNHVVAKFSNGATIMPVIKGVSFNTAGVDNREVAQMLVNMPQKAYDDLVLQVYNAEEKGMILDLGYKNIIIDSDNQKMTAIDFDKRNCYSVENDILNALCNCLVNTKDFNKTELNQVYVKLFNAFLNIMQMDNNIKPEKFGFTNFVDKVVKDSHYARILKRHFVKLTKQNPQSQKADYSRQVIRQVVNQFFSEC